MTADAYVSLIPRVGTLLADEGYEKNKIKCVVPAKSNRKTRIRHGQEAYKGRNIVARLLAVM